MDAGLIAVLAGGAFALVAKAVEFGWDYLRGAVKRSNNEWDDAIFELVDQAVSGRVDEIRGAVEGAIEKKLGVTLPDQGQKAE